LFAASLLMLYVLVKSPFGRSLEGIREREVRMRTLGYNTWLHKYLAFIIAGGFGGLAGVLWAHANGHVSPEDVVLTTSVDALLMVVLGGPGTLVGGAIGATVVLFLREYLSTLGRPGQASGGCAQGREAHSPGQGAFDHGRRAGLDRICIGTG
jgi:branched-chain amino acid transport system permease protein